MGKYNNKKEHYKGSLADHKRVCRNCGLVTYYWDHCGIRTARFSMEGNRPIIISSVERQSKEGIE